MITVSRKYELIVRTPVSAYLKANKDVVVPGAKIIGSNVTAVGKMISLSDEAKVLMPSILGMAHNSPEWDKGLKRYWDSLSHPISPIGGTLETGFVYDVTDTSRIKYLTEINKQLELAKAKPLSTDEDLKNYIYSKIDKAEENYNNAVLDANKLPEREKDEQLKLAYDTKWNTIWNIEAEHYKVGTPINPFEYLLWKYCLVYPDVANDVAFVNKSPKIRFYLSSEDAKQRIEQHKVKVKQQAMEAYLKLISERSKVINVLFAMGLGNNVFEISKNNSNREALDLQMHILLQSEMDKNPERFITASSDKNLAIKGMIEKYISYNVLRRLTGTNIIVDYADGSKIIGNDLNAAITFFSNQENKAVISEYETRFKDLNSNLDTAKKEEVKPNPPVPTTTNPTGN